MEGPAVQEQMHNCELLKMFCVNENLVVDVNINIVLNSNHEWNLMSSFSNKCEIMRFYFL